MGSTIIILFSKRRQWSVVLYVCVRALFWRQRTIIVFTLLQHCRRLIALLDITPLFYCFLNLKCF